MFISNTDSHCQFRVDESTSLSTIQAACSTFFKTPHGKRETYDTYRGFLIVRNTVQFTGGKPERRTTVYLFDLDTNDTFCVSAGVDLSGVAHAEALIDRILTMGEYHYGTDVVTV